MIKMGGSEVYGGQHVTLELSLTRTRACRLLVQLLLAVSFHLHNKV